MLKKTLLCFIMIASLNASENIIKKDSLTLESKQTNSNSILTPTDNSTTGCNETENKIEFLSKDKNLFSDVVIQACEK